MIKYLNLIVLLNESDLSLLFENKVIYLLFESEEILAMELPEGSEDKSDFMRLFRTSIKDRLDEIEGDNEILDNPEVHIEKLNKALECVNF